MTRGNETMIRGGYPWIRGAGGLKRPVTTGPEAVAEVILAAENR